MGKDERTPEAGHAPAVIPPSADTGVPEVCLDAEKAVVTAKTLLSELNNAISAGHGSAARSALNALRSIPIPPGRMGVLVAQYLALGSSAGATVEALEMEEMSADEAAMHASSTKSTYCLERTQRLVMREASADIRDYFIHQLRDSPPDVREAFTDVTAHSLTGPERERVRRELKQPEHMTQKEVSHLHTSLHRLERHQEETIRRSLPQGQQQERLGRMRECFRKAHDCVDEAHQAERAAAGSPALPELRKRREARREAMAEALENGVIRQEMMGQPPRQRRQEPPMPPRPHDAPPAPTELTITAHAHEGTDPLPPLHTPGRPGTRAGFRTGGVA